MNKAMGKAQVQKEVPIDRLSKGYFADNKDFLAFCHQFFQKNLFRWPQGYAAHATRQMALEKRLQSKGVGAGKGKRGTKEKNALSENLIPTRRGKTVWLKGDEVPKVVQRRLEKQHMSEGGEGQSNVESDAAVDRAAEKVQGGNKPPSVAQTGKPSALTEKQLARKHELKRLMGTLNEEISERLLNLRQNLQESTRLREEVEYLYRDLREVEHMCLKHAAEPESKEILTHLAEAPPGFLYNYN